MRHKPHLAMPSRRRDQAAHRQEIRGQTIRSIRSRAAGGLMPAFDYSTVAELFSTRTEAELFPARARKRRHELVGYGRFARAADAIRFAIEELPEGLRPEACLEVNTEIFD